MFVTLIYIFFLCGKMDSKKLYFFFLQSAKRKSDEPATCSSDKKAKIQSSKSTKQKTSSDMFTAFQPFSFFLTKVKDIKNEYNSAGALSLKGIRLVLCVCVVEYEK